MVRMTQRFRVTISFVLTVGILSAGVWACETPVYRYAMYRWQPAPYEVYFLHDRPISDDDLRVGELLSDYGRQARTPTNLAYISVNLAEDPELNSVPPDVKQAWLGRADRTLPAYYISTPYGASMGFEKLDASIVETLVKSPARKSLAAQLEMGKLGVFVLVKGPDEAANKEAEAVLTDLVEEVLAGKLSLYVSPTQAATITEDDARTEQAAPSFDLGLLAIDRASQEEAWLIRSLLVMEPELAAESQPMVFLVYGRARALLPYIGKGITRENLIREIEFISGACSCTVKEQNPGFDLLVQYDWESAAAALAEKFGSEEGTEGRFGPQQFFPELIIPSAHTPAATDVTVAEVKSDEVASEDEAVIEEDSEPVADPIVEAEQLADETALVENSDSEKEVAVVSPGPGAAARTVASTNVSSPTSRFVWIVGAGVAVALVVLFGLTFVVLRPQ